MHFVYWHVLSVLSHEVFLTKSARKILQADPEFPFPPVKHQSLNLSAWPGLTTTFRVIHTASAWFSYTHIDPLSPGEHYIVQKHTFFLNTYFQMSALCWNFIQAIFFSFGSVSTHSTIETWITSSSVEEITQDFIQICSRSYHSMSWSCHTAFLEQS